MENFQQYRDNLANELKNEPDKAKRKAILQSKKDTAEYETAKKSHFEEDIFKPDSFGVLADTKGKVDMSEVSKGIFGDIEKAIKFCDLGLGEYEDGMPHQVTFVDFGGGKGVLANSVKDWLEKHGHEVRAIVADANKDFLKRARDDFNLETVLCRLDDQKFSDLDLVTMRSVLQYNQKKVQEIIIKRIFDSLKNGGLFVNQIATGGDKNNKLRSQISSLSVESVKGEYYWVTFDEYREMLEKAGFKDIKIGGAVADAVWGPEDMWNRFNGNALKEAIDKNDTERVSYLENNRKLYLEKINKIIEDYLKEGGEDLGIEKDEKGLYKIRNQFDVVTCRK